MEKNSLGLLTHLKVYMVVADWGRIRILNLKRISKRNSIGEQE